MKNRKTTKIVNAVIRSMRFGDFGRYWSQEFMRSPKGRAVEDAHTRNHMAEETSDEREYRNARIALRLHGSFRAAVISDTLTIAA